MRNWAFLTAAAVFAAPAAPISTKSDATISQNPQLVAQADAQVSAKRKKPPPTSPGYQIACTRTGCHPIPRGCQIEKEFSWDGLPTGFDLVVCPHR